MKMTAAGNRESCFRLFLPGKYFSSGTDCGKMGEKGSVFMKILVSACLLGRNCKYNGGSNFNPAVAAFVADKDVVEYCPEVMAGLGIPRTPIEIVDGVLTDREGNHVDTLLREAVAKALAEIRELDVDCAILQSRSPTCGVNQVYDGTFSGKLIPGSGVFAQALKDSGYKVIDAEDVK